MRGSLRSSSAAKSLQSCPTLWDPIDGSPPGSPVPGILQARTLEWTAMPSFLTWWRELGLATEKHRTTTSDLGVGESEVIGKKS